MTEGTLTAILTATPMNVSEQPRTHYVDNLANNATAADGAEQIGTDGGVFD
jgi:hypothetical protein